MSNSVLKEVTSTVLPFIVLGGGAFLLVKSGILGKVLSDLTGGIGKKADELYSSVYNSKTMETIREYTTIQNIIEKVVDDQKTYVPTEYYDPEGNVVVAPDPWSEPDRVITTEGRNLIPVSIPGAEKDYVMTVLGPAKYPEDGKFTVKTPGHFVSSKEPKAWWQNTSIDVFGHIFDILTGKNVTYATPPAVSSSAYHSGIITPVEKTEMETIPEKQTVVETISRSSSGGSGDDNDVAARVYRDTKRNLEAKAANEARLAAAEAYTPGGFPTPSESCYGGSVKHDMRTPEGKAELAAKAAALHESLGGRVR